MKLENILKFALIGSACALPNIDAQVLAAYNPTQTATVAAPVMGVSATDDKYLLSNIGTTGQVNKDLSGYEGLFSNPFTPAQDSSSFIPNSGYMLQLSGGGAINAVNISDGSPDVSLLGGTSINVSAPNETAFMVGYDPVSNRIGAARFNSALNEVTLLQYAVGNTTPIATTTFAYDPSQWGTLTGGDLVNVHGQVRFLMTAHGALDERDRPLNKILNTNFSDGSIDEYLVGRGSGFQIQDLHFEEGNIVVGYVSGLGGRVDIVPYSPIPEPAVFGLGAGVLALAGAALHKRRRQRSVVASR